MAAKLEKFLTSPGFPINFRKANEFLRVISQELQELWAKTFGGLRCVKAWFAKVLKIPNLQI